MKELIFEEVRKEVDTELPSRMKCLYVCESMEDINKWLEIFKRTNKKNKDYQIVKLELTGKCVTLDASYVLRQNISLNKKREQAKSYWNGEVKDDENGEAYCLEANTLPGMTLTSLLPQEAAVEGLSYADLCEKIIEISLNKK